MNENSDKGENGGFCTLLREVQGGRKPIDALFEDPIFRSKFRPIIAAHRQKPEDAEELANNIRYKVWHSLPRFEPDYTHEYGKFFAWLRTVTRNSFLDTLLNDDAEFIDDRAEDLPIPDPKIDLEARVLYNERVDELERCTNTLPERERMAVTHYVLEGLSSRETTDRLIKAGFPCTHVTVLKWVRDGLKPFFPNAEAFSIEDLERKATKLARARTGEEASSTKVEAKPSIKKSAKS